ncbi:MAG: hypothetical protein WCQ70_12100 [Lentimicrobiaceae bacterium]
MNIKFTSDGRKVTVVGKLNAQETIVQEIFITQDGAEIPSGENFVVKSLHDTPVKSWKEVEIEKVEQQYQKGVVQRRQEIANLERRHYTLTGQVHQKIEYLCDLIRNFSEEHCKTLEAFINDKIKYIVEYDEIREFEPYDNFDGKIKLISLMGSSKGNLEFRLHSYSDGSGGSHTLMPFETMEEAKAYLQKKIDDTEGYYDKIVQSAKKYGLVLDNAKLNIYKDQEVDRLNQYIEQSTKKINEYKEQLKTLEDSLCH